MHVLCHMSGAAPSVFFSWAGAASPRPEVMRGTEVRDAAAAIARQREAAAAAARQREASPEARWDHLLAPSAHGARHSIQIFFPNWVCLEGSHTVS